MPRSSWGLVCGGIILSVLTGSYTAFTAVAELKNETGLLTGGINLHSGDVLFVRGSGILSQAVLTADNTSTYSHTGLIQNIGSTSFVIHAAPGDSLAQETKIFVEPLSSVLSRSKAAAVYRLPELDSDIGERAAFIAQKWADDGKTFDAAFRLDTTDALYCTELVWRAYKEAGVDLVEGRFDKIQFAFYGGDVLFPSRLLESPYLHLVHRFKSKGESS